MNEKIFSLLMLTALIPAAQAIEPAPAPVPSNSVAINNSSAASNENKTIVCSEITDRIAIVFVKIYHLLYRARKRRESRLALIYDICHTPPPFILIISNSPEAHKRRRGTCF